jgi:hypothetical protein
MTRRCGPGVSAVRGFRRGSGRLPQNIHELDIPCAAQAKQGFQGEIPHPSLDIRRSEMGASPKRITAALNVPVRVVKAYMNLLMGIHPEAADRLKDKNMTPRTLYMFRRVNGVRQVKIAELMGMANNYTTGCGGLDSGNPQEPAQQQREAEDAQSRVGGEARPAPGNGNP